MYFNKKGLSPVVAIALLLVVSVVAVVGYQQWYQGYQSILTSDVEQKSKASGSIKIEYISSDGTLYVTNSGTSNLTMGSLEISGSECVITDELVPGVNKLDITSCLNSTGTNDVVIVTDSGIIEEKLFVEEVVASGGSQSLGNLNLLRFIDNPNNYSTGAGDSFGYVTDISGNNAIVGAYLEDDASGIQSGKAYIFDVTTGNLLHVLDNPNNYSTSEDDWFSRGGVAISGNLALVSAYGEDEATCLSSGKAYIFDVTTGNLLRTLDNPNNYSTCDQDFFGGSLAMDGNYAIFGVHNEDDAGGAGSGKAYIFDVSTGSLLHVLDNPNNYSGSASDYFGVSVSISGNYAIVGANGEGDAGGLGSGKAYIFDITTGNLLHVLDNPNAYGTSSGDKFGYTVAMSNNYALVGAYDEDDANGTRSGKAYIFDVTTGNLLHTLDNPNNYSTSLDDYFSRPLVSITDNYALVGAYAEDDADGIYSGKAYIFDVTTGNLLKTLHNPNNFSTSTNDQFAMGGVIDDNYVLIGAIGESGPNVGGVLYVFDLS